MHICRRNARAVLRSPLRIYEPNESHLPDAALQGVSIKYDLVTVHRLRPDEDAWQA